MRPAQTPHDQLNGTIAWHAPRDILAAMTLHYVSQQFDDDQNQFKLPGYAAIQLSAQQRLTKDLFAQVAVENLLDRQYLVALTPNPNTGAPRLWRIGLRWNGRLP